jgi:hypothetical protein
MVCVREAPLPSIILGSLVSLGEEYSPAHPRTARAWGGLARPLLCAVGHLLGLGLDPDVGWPRFYSLVGLLSLL